MIKLNDDLLKEKELLKEEIEKWEKKGTEREKVVEEKIKEYENLNQQYNKLVQDILKHKRIIKEYLFYIISL